MSPDELTELVAQMRRLGVRSYKAGDTCIELTPEDPSVEVAKTTIPVRTAEDLSRAERARQHGIMFMASSVKPILK